MSETTVVTNARVVTRTGVVDGSVAFEDGRIIEVSARHFADGFDVNGALLMPGVVDAHTDYIEKEISPRPGAEVSLEMAMHMMDLRALACGLTTVLSGARITHERSGPAGTWHEGMYLAREIQQRAPRMRARHRVHVRWDTRYTPIDDNIAELCSMDGIGNLVFNDSMPGVRQYRDMDELVRKQALRLNISIEASRALMDEKVQAALAVDNRAATAAALKGRFPLGSHDDTTVEHVDEAFALGATLCEMPVTIEAARRAKELGMLVCMGAPNYVRGGSHCGNLAAHEAFAEGLVDMLCSDYHFPSLLASAVLMVASGESPSRVAELLALNPARHLGVDAELGSIEIGKLADLVAFHPREGYADVTCTWVGGRLQFAAHDARAALAAR
ncbi:MAG TPA: alpha-D-ribose 1-methylphosphonate 5-triphosphate diphosphatase [Candidatus Acidoferrum sp.]|nr:alpha-D-ribose 1-methylphosphonate 5-triphosphate diphosphatase [Candidatus Acidoferrum sp.]